MKESSADVWSWFHQSQGLQGVGLVKGGLLLIQFCLQRSPIFTSPSPRSADMASGLPGATRWSQWR